MVPAMDTRKPEPAKEEEVTLRLRELTPGTERRHSISAVSESNGEVRHPHAGPSTILANGSLGPGQPEMDVGDRHSELGPDFGDPEHEGHSRTSHDYSPENVASNDGLPENASVHDDDKHWMVTIARIVSHIHYVGLSLKSPWRSFSLKVLIGRKCVPPRLS
jgi:hypothetical protein